MEGDGGVRSMEYCKFRNALSDVCDIRNALNDMGGSLDPLSKEELEAAIKTIQICRQIGEEWSE
jgi:hypothetical protein